MVSIIIWWIHSIEERKKILRQNMTGSSSESDLNRWIPKKLWRYAFIKVNHSYTNAYKSIVENDYIKNDLILKKRKLGMLVPDVWGCSLVYGFVEELRWLGEMGGEFKRPPTEKVFLIFIFNFSKFKVIINKVIFSQFWIYIEKWKNKSFE